MAEITTTEIVLDLDVSKAEVSWEAIEEAMESLLAATSKISKMIEKTLEPLQDTLNKTVGSVNELNKSLQSLMQQMSKEQNVDQLLDGISTTVEGLSLFAAVIKPAKRAIESIVKAIREYTSAVKFALPESGLLAAVFPKLSSMLIDLGGVLKGIGGKILGVFAKFVPKIAAIVAIVTVAISTIIAFAKNWDKISSAVQSFVTQTLPQAWNQLAQWFQNVGAVVAAAVNEALNVIVGLFSACWNQITSLWDGLIAWFDSTIIQPLAEKISGVWEWIKQLLESIKQTVSDMVYNLGVMIGGSWEIVKAVWGHAVQWLREHVIVPVCNAWNTVCAAVENAFAIVKEYLAQVCSWIYANVAAPLGSLLSGIWGGLVNGATVAWETVKTVFGNVAKFFGDIFRTAWQGITEALGGAWSWFESKVFNPLVDGVKNGVNSVIGFINNMISAVVKGINGLINVLNQLKFTVPDWVPGLGGSVFGFQLKSLTAPQIPYLAKGAVLPANKPFLAVVGDQRHGTNVEAPLATIQEAVAVVLDEQLSALMAGFNATVEELRLLRQTVGDIQIGDAVIGRAAERYREKRAVMYGCGW